MAELRMFQVDAFADRPFSGDPAAVFVLDAPLPAATMQAIAAENNLSETAYVTRHPLSRGDAGDWHIRWFTPREEAAFCGHATLAAAHVLRTEYGVCAPYRLHTDRVGPLSVSVADGGRYLLDLPSHEPRMLDEAPAGVVLTLEALFPDGYAAAFRNFENLFVVLASPEAVRAYQPDLPRIAALHAFGLVITAAGGTDAAGATVDFVSRYFAPGAGIDEDPATGSTHATLVPYWAAQLGRSDLRAYQASPRGAAIGCRLSGGRVLLTGAAVTVLRATFLLPD